MSHIEQLADGFAMHLGVDVMPTLRMMDHVITDPPYEDELHRAIGRIRRNDGQEMIHSLV